ncbi:acetylornithine aminotransferase [Peribacillus deserti]|uniref:Acetylornithine aminotransferase n=1 Tax=Peribacillus deserti TaxID=673318 RepID=A0ABS2QMJ5_9BACI|nr:acetylornithine transaminase [Peribacillus deserti]MBM7693974.1 acetylornithine aminotransferase [Peribacillus deserti]
MSHLFPTYGRWNIEPAAGKGSYLIDQTGKEYLDFTSGIGVLNFGHCHPDITESVKKQLDKFWHTSNLFSLPVQEETASAIAELSGLERVFFSNSGAEANEAAIKLARKATGKSKIITCYQSFHGRTFATMAATGQEKVRTGYGQMLETFKYIEFNSIQDLEDAADNETAAIMLEIVQGEGGIHIIKPEFIKKLEEIRSKTGALLIIDEVQTGIGRTGKSFAFQHFDIKPDIITLAKGLGNGIPVGAMAGREELAEFFGPGSHGSTFGGNPISLASAKAVLSELTKEGFTRSVEEKGKLLIARLQDELQESPVVKEIRGLGLMVGIELKEDAAPYLKALQKQGLLTLPAGPNIVRLLPPLTVTEIELNKAIEHIAQTLAKKKQVV